MPTINISPDDRTPDPSQVFVIPANNRFVVKDRNGNVVSERGAIPQDQEIVWPSHNNYLYTAGPYEAEFHPI